MATMTFEQAALFEHRFWLQILGDHARFIFHALSPNETEAIGRAQAFMQAFDGLLQEACETGTATLGGLADLALRAQHEVAALRDFKLELLRKKLIGNISIGMSETFFNHMVNELDEYVRILSYLVQDRLPPCAHALHHHLLWVSDASAHAGVLSDYLDGTEKKLRRRGMEFEQDFAHFYLKAIELTGYLRANVHAFPALARFNSDVELELTIFKQFLHELEELALSKQLLGVFTPLMADHMAREECYYLWKLADSNGTPPPMCDPSQPRVTPL
jgi:hypothetical protein